jgi:hypothetical protein
MRRFCLWPKYFYYANKIEKILCKRQHIIPYQTALHRKITEMKTNCCHKKQVHFIANKIVCANQACHNYLAPTKLMHDVNHLKIIAAFSLFFFYLVFTIDNFSMTNKKPQWINRIAAQKPEVPLNIINLQNELEKQHIICINEVLAQLRLESANFTSSLFKRTNNLSGMRYPLNRPTLACGIYLVTADTIIYDSHDDLKKFAAEDNYSVYTTWQDAISDYRLWQENTFKVNERYLDFLGAVYAEDSLYVKKIKQLYID